MTGYAPTPRAADMQPQPILPLRINWYTATLPSGEVVSKQAPAGSSDEVIRGMFAAPLAKYRDRGVVIDRMQTPEQRFRAAYGDQGTITASDPTWRETVSSGINVATGMRNLGDKLTGALDFIPGIGEVAGAADTAESVKKRDWLGAGINAIGTALGTVPVVGDAAAGGLKAMFLGVKAKNADHAALSAAQQMEGAGAPREAIRQATGWFKGSDQKWRFEIDDSPLEFRNSGAATMGEAIHHPELFANYPEMGSIRFGREEGNSAAHTAPWGGEPEEILLGKEIRNPRSALAHELQHGVQSREGFTPGSNPEIAPRVYEGPHVAAANARISAYERGLQAIKPRWFSGNQAARKNIENALQRSLDARWDAASFEGYQRVGGEVEARNVQTRLDYSPAQRSATAPWATADRTPEQQIHPLKPEWLRPLPR